MKKHLILTTLGLISSLSLTSCAVPKIGMVIPSGIWGDERISFWTSKKESVCTDDAKALPVSTGNVKMGFSDWIGWFPWEVQKKRKVFERNKVSVDLQWFDDYAKSVSLLEEGKIDANNQTLTETISSVSNGADLVVVLTTDNSHGADQMIVSEKIKSIRDLKGQKVAVEPGSVDHFFLGKLLARAGMSFNDIKLAPMESKKAATAFASGEVEATVIYAPLTLTALNRPGSHELFDSLDFAGAISDHLVFTRKFVNDHPDRVQAVVDSWFASPSGCNTKDKQDGDLALMAKRAKVSVEDFKDLAQGVKVFDAYYNNLAFQVGRKDDNTYLSTTAPEISEFLFKNGLIKNKPDTAKIFDDRFVKAHFARIGT
jgi:NitT/TauT family transport system substrate-binding protein